jgi:hypothetical protein
LSSHQNTHAAIMGPAPSLTAWLNQLAACYYCRLRCIYWKVPVGSIENLFAGSVKILSPVGIIRRLKFFGLSSHCTQKFRFTSPITGCHQKGL